MGADELPRQPRPPRRLIVRDARWAAYVRGPAGRALNLDRPNERRPLVLRLNGHALRHARLAGRAEGGRQIQHLSHAGGAANARRTASVASRGVARSRPGRLLRLPGRTLFLPWHRGTILDLAPTKREKHELARKPKAAEAPMYHEAERLLRPHREGMARRNIRVDWRGCVRRGKRLEPALAIKGRSNLVTYTDPAPSVHSLSRPTLGLARPHDGPLCANP
jgi:hypothetical protein